VVWTCAACLGLMAQSNALWDDTRVASIHVSIDPDSLAVLYDDVTATHYYVTQFIYDDGGVRDTVAQVGFRLRGNTSRAAAKKSFKLSFNTY
jgi:hypothetical protein